MSILEEYNGLSPKPAVSKIDKWLEDITEDSVKEFSTLAKDLNVEPTRLWRACTKNGLEISQTAFRDYINKLRATK